MHIFELAMNLNDTVLIKFLLKYVDVMGMNPKNRTKFTNILAGFNYMLMITLYVANIIEAVMSIHEDDIIEKLTFTSVMTVTLYKLIWWNYKGKKINKALGLIDKMWAFDKLGVDEEKLNIKRANFTYTLIKIYAADFYGTTLALMFFYYIYDTLVIPGYYGCDLKDKTCYNTIFFVQIPVLSYLVVAAEISFDCFFFAIIAFVYIAADQIKKSFRKWNTISDSNESKKFLKEILEQHLNLLEFIDVVKDLYEQIFFVQFGATIFNMTFVLYIVTYQGFPPSLEVLLLFSFLYLCYALQVGNLCLGGTILSEQMESIATEAYNTEWYNKPIGESKSLMMIIMKAQLSAPVYAGALVPLNLDTFTNVITVSFKVCAAIKTVTGLK